MPSKNAPNTPEGDEQHKCTNSNITKNQKRRQSTILGPAFVSDVSTILRTEEGDCSERISRRRRLSIKSSCSDLKSSCSAENDGQPAGNNRGQDEQCATSRQRKDDIRHDLGQATSDLQLPDPKESISPDEFLMKLVKVICNVELEAKQARSLDGFFCSVSDEQMAAYTINVVSAVRTNDIEALKALHSEGQILNCFNRFGESLLTMACRRGFEEIVAYLLHQPDIDIRISDDSGRTVLHDVCWNPSPQLKICKWILEREPALFFILDNRGCSAFHYARPEHWGIWRQFLLDNREALTALKKEEILSKLAKSSKQN